jgi:hypothetical protein
MSISLFRALLVLFGGGFAVAFVLIVLPPLLREADVIAAFAAGFVNPYATGYALDAILCWCVLAVWVIHEARSAGVRHGWLALVLGIVPGVATGFAVYLLLRLQQKADRRD